MLINRKSSCGNVCFLKVLIILLVAVFWPGKVFAAPYKGEVFRLKQPDGSYAPVKVWGDEFYRRVESLDGYTLVRDNNTRWICYADLSDDGNDFVPTDVIYRGRAADAGSLKSKRTGLNLRKNLKLRKESVVKRVEEARQAFLAGTEESEGNVVKHYEDSTLSGSTTTSKSILGLTILVDFPDEQAKIDKAEIDAFLNQRGYNGYDNHGSARDYFADVSNNYINYTNILTGYYTAEHNKDYYTDANRPFAESSRELALEGLRKLNNDGFDFSSLTTYPALGKNWIWAVNVLYAGEVDNVWGEGLWPHQSYLLYPYEADGVCVSRYQIMNIGDPCAEDSDSNALPLNLRVFCHENGHLLFDWPDLYDYDFDSNGVGDYCLMGYGGANRNPVPPNPYLQSLQGWVGVTEISGNNVGSIYYHEANSFNAYRFSNFDNPKELFLIECRLKTGRHDNLPDEGLIIWHIDENGSNDYQQMKPSWHYKVSVEQADGMFDLENNRNCGDTNDMFHRGHNDSFDDWTQPDARWWNGAPSGLVISNISDVNSTMSFFALTLFKVKKCLVKAGKTDNSDMILISGLMDATTGDISAASSIEVTIDSEDMVRPCVLTFPINDKAFKNGKYNYARTESASKRLFKYDTKNGKFTFMVKNVDLTGLGCPLTIEIKVGNYVGLGETDENVVNGPRRKIPIQLMMGVKDILRVDKCKVRSGKNPSTDSLSVKGAFAVEDTSVALENETVTITLGTQTFTIPDHSLQPYKNTFTCRNVEIIDGGIVSIVSAKFDFIKSSFTIAIKKAAIQSKSGTVNFGIAFGSFNESVEVEL